MNRVVAAFAIAGVLLVQACGFFGPGAGEEVRQQPQRTVYRSTDSTLPGEESVPRKKQKVPGE